MAHSHTHSLTCRVSICAGCLLYLLNVRHKYRHTPGDGGQLQMVVAGTQGKSPPTESHLHEYNLGGPEMGKVSQIPKCDFGDIFARIKKLMKLSFPEIIYCIY